MIQASFGFSICQMVIAFVVTTLVFPYILTFARKHKIVDNPNSRKLQRVPVPVMGGTTVFIGLLTSAIIGFFVVRDTEIFKVLILLFVMYIIGVWDDIRDIPATFKFVVEIFVVWAMIVVLDVEINNFHGFLGIHEIPDRISVPLSLIAGVGIINGINLIDGVDGYCSTYGALACTAYAIIFYYVGDLTMFTMAVITIGAIIPFFFHNVFGRTSKMFLGDGGSLMLGTLLALFAFTTLSGHYPFAEYGKQGLSIVALNLAILAVPVFDTVRVMIWRVAKGTSPFNPDKTHLHHIFIDMGFSHLATSGLIVFCNAEIIAISLACWLIGVSIDWQVYIVIIASLLLTHGFYFFMDSQRQMNEGEGSAIYNRWRKHGKATNIASTAGWQFLQKMVDSRFLGGTTSIIAKQEYTSDNNDNSTGIDPRVS